jgi:hypothetical protein
LDITDQDAVLAALAVPAISAAPKTQKKLAEAHPQAKGKARKSSNNQAKQQGKNQASQGKASAKPPPAQKPKPQSAASATPASGNDEETSLKMDRKNVASRAYHAARNKVLGELMRQAAADQPSQDMLDQAKAAGREASRKAVAELDRVAE